MKIYRGIRALSKFRTEKLLRSLQAELDSINALSTEFLHFVQFTERKAEAEVVADAETEAEAEDQVAAQGTAISSQHSVLQQLLHYGEEADAFKASNQLIVVPRLGTISPWSTKATDIAKHCGLAGVERIERSLLFHIDSRAALGRKELALLATLLHDPMTESVLFNESEAEQLFTHHQPTELEVIPLRANGLDALAAANDRLGLALSAEEMQYLAREYQSLGLDPTDVELMMFAQVNSEHCRHKIFNARWSIDNQDMPHSLFDMVRQTHARNSKGTLVAYADNSSVLEGSPVKRFAPIGGDHEYQSIAEPAHIICKVETHNHPTAISPFAGAATGSGGEIRDEGATGRGSKPKAGLTGFSVSHLRIPELPQPWEGEQSKPGRIASPLQIMLDGPIGAAAFNNEFGRPNIAGYFRTFEQDQSAGPIRRGFHKPIMLAGGMGSIRPGHVDKQSITDGAPIVVLGGPAMLIGLGGGAASSMSSGSSSEELDFASVQRGNPEMQRRCQEVIDACCALGDASPIASIHDVGAGGLCNALPELVGDSGRGGNFELRRVLNDEPGMSPMQIWCNESQERYTLAIHAEQLDEFIRICERERCLYCVVGKATKDEKLVLTDDYFSHDGGRCATPIDLPMSTLLGNTPKMHRQVHSSDPELPESITTDDSIEQLFTKVLQFPAVGDKSFLITIGDRSVGGMIARDQMVGPWQVPVADVAVTTSDYYGEHGEAMAIGERTPIATLNPRASGRMSVAEALTNIMAADIRDLAEIKLSANWMAAAGHQSDDSDLYATVEAVTLDVCMSLGISIPVGKDSMSMKTSWQPMEDTASTETVAAPISCIISAFAPVTNTSLTLTPQLRLDEGDSSLLLIDLGDGKSRLGASALAQVLLQQGGDTPDVEDCDLLKNTFFAVQQLLRSGKLLAYHDRSDGGLAACMSEMAFAGRCGLDIELEHCKDLVSFLFNEELGALIQIKKSDVDEVHSVFAKHHIGHIVAAIGRPVEGQQIKIQVDGNCVFEAKRSQLQRLWSNTSYQMQRLRDNPRCADEEHKHIVDEQYTGLFSILSFDPLEDVCAPYIGGHRPSIAILREQGVNSHVEMAAAFTQAGFRAVDVTMTDLISGRVSLQSFHGMVACGGFSYGDVLGAGEGWAKSILYNRRALDEFSAYFQREDAFSLGICNGCQMMANLKRIIPGAETWPKFMPNQSEQYEARFVQTAIPRSSSILLDGMQDSSFPVVVAHGEGRAQFASSQQLQQSQSQVCLQYVNSQGEPTERYPMNPNGSADGIAGLCSENGLVTIMMPHPERVFRSITNSWNDSNWGHYSPWMRMFRNGRRWLE